MIYHTQQKVALSSFYTFLCDRITTTGTYSYLGLVKRKGPLVIWKSRCDLCFEDDVTITYIVLIDISSCDISTFNTT